MATKQSKNKVLTEESTKYESLIGYKEKTGEPASVLDFMDLDESERLSAEQRDDVEWKKHWVGMPEFVQEDNPAYKKLIVSFRNKEDYEEFAKLIGQPLTEKTKTIWHPRLDREANSLLRWVVE
jgi:hypothetical protein